MSAQILRRAAALMRERAEAVVANVDEWYEADEVLVVLRRSEPTNTAQPFDAEHIASWHPAVALAVADWLDSVHVNLDTYNATTPQSLHAFAVARAYLGESA